MAAGATGRVRIGALPVAIPTLVNAVLQSVRAHLPDLVVTVTEGTNDMLLPALARNELDMVLGRLSADTTSSAFVSERLYDEPVRLVVRKKHPLLRKRTLAVNDLAGMQWVLPPESAPLRMQLESLLANHGLGRPVPHTETTSQMLVEIILNQTNMVAAMPFRVAQLYQSRGQLVILDMFLPITMPPVGLLLHAHALLSPAVEAVIRLVRLAAQAQCVAGDTA